MRLRLQFVPVAMVLLGAPVGAVHAGPMNAKRARSRAQSAALVRWRRAAGKGQGPCRALRGAPAGSAYAPSDYYVHDASKLPFGSERWRDQMRRENRLGNPG